MTYSTEIAAITRALSSLQERHEEAADLAEAIGHLIDALDALGQTWNLGGKRRHDAESGHLMSEWLVSRRHIDALVTAARTTANGYAPDLWVKDADGNGCPDATGRMLWTECLKSVSARYPRDGDGERPGPAGLTDAEIAGYTYTPPTRIAGGEVGATTTDPAALLKLLDCYEYQSCGHDGWKSSRAHKFCKELRTHLIATLPGYQAAPWGIS